MALYSIQAKKEKISLEKVKRREAL